MLDNSRHRFVHGDICDGPLVEKIINDCRIDAIINFAAESHVDRSITGPKIFIETNVTGTLTLLQAARDKKLERFIQVSTDEVYGSLGPQGKFTEQSPLSPNSPYSASKAGADLLVRAFGHTWGLRYNITRCSNNYGPYQFPEKLIPLMINNALHDKELPVYGDGLYVRDWLYVYDHCTAIWQVLEKAPPGEIYNIGGCNEKANLEVIEIILERLQQTQDADPPREGPPRPRPPLRHRRRQDHPRTRLEALGHLRRGHGPNHRLVPGQPALARPRHLRRLPEVLRIHVRQPLSLFEPLLGRASPHDQSGPLQWIGYDARPGPWRDERGRSFYVEPPNPPPKAGRTPHSYRSPFS